MFSSTSNPCLEGFVGLVHKACTNSVRLYQRFMESSGFCVYSCRGLVEFTFQSLTSCHPGGASIQAWLHKDYAVIGLGIVSAVCDQLWCKCYHQRLALFMQLLFKALCGVHAVVLQNLSSRVGSLF